MEPNQTDGRGRRARADHVKVPAGTGAANPRQKISASADGAVLSKQRGPVEPVMGPNTCQEQNDTLLERLCGPNEHLVHHSNQR